jgi:hypothetical protein
VAWLYFFYIRQIVFWWDLLDQAKIAHTDNNPPMTCQWPIASADMKRLIQSRSADGDHQGFFVLRSSITPDL